MPKLNLPAPTLEENYTHPILGPGHGPYAYIALGDLGGLTQFGVHIEILPPGSGSSFRHWHEAEDEMMVMLEGEVVLIEDEERILRPGDVVCWPAGLPVAHCLRNRSDRPARYLIVGTRAEWDRYHYPDHDLVTTRDGKTRHYAHADGRPYAVQKPVGT